MSTRRYPRLAWCRPYKGNPKCWKDAKCPCGNPGIYKVEIQTSPFRGDDKHESRCEVHKAEPHVQTSTPPPP